MELHGDRAGYDDPALITGIGRMDGESYVFIAHQKGRNTKENIKRNFGMPTPHGYVYVIHYRLYSSCSYLTEAVDSVRSDILYLRTPWFILLSFFKLQSKYV